MIREKADPTLIASPRSVPARDRRRPAIVARASRWQAVVAGLKGPELWRIRRLLSGPQLSPARGRRRPALVAGPHLSSARAHSRSAVVAGPRSSPARARRTDLSPASGRRRPALWPNLAYLVRVRRCYRPTLFTRAASLGGYQSESCSRQINLSAQDMVPGPSQDHPPVLHNPPIHLMPSQQQNWKFPAISLQYMLALPKSTNAVRAIMWTRRRRRQWRTVRSRAARMVRSRAARAVRSNAARAGRSSAASTMQTRAVRLFERIG